MSELDKNPSWLLSSLSNRMSESFTVSANPFAFQAVSISDLLTLPSSEISEIQVKVEYDWVP